MRYISMTKARKYFYWIRNISHEIPCGENGDIFLSHDQLGRTHDVLEYLRGTSLGTMVEYSSTRVPATHNDRAFKLS